MQHTTRTIWRFLLAFARRLGGSGAVHFIATRTEPLTLSESHTAARLLRGVRIAEAAEVPTETGPIGPTQIDEETAEVISRLEDLVNVPLDAPERPVKLGWLLQRVAGNHGADGEDLAHEVLGMEHCRAIKESQERQRRLVHEEPIPEVTVCAGLYQFPHAPAPAMFYERHLGRLMLFNPRTLMAVALEMLPEVEESFKDITGAGVAGLRRRYGQEHMLKLFEGLAMMPTDWAKWVEEVKDLATTKPA